MLKLYKESRISIFSTSPTVNSYSFGSVGDPRNGLDDSESSTESDSSVITVHPGDINPVQLVINNEAYCFDIDRFAEKFVDATLEEAQKRGLKEPVTYTSLDIIQAIIEILISRAINFEMGNTKPSFSLSGTGPLKLFSTSTFWPKISEFNIKLGQEQVEMFVQTWKRSSDWLFCVEFLGFESEDCSNVFVYEVEWSKPTKAYPIPQVTASVYFALEVFKMVPTGHDRSVDVSYIFEYSFVIHKPGKIDFQEKWLQDIIDEKLKLFKKMTISVSIPILNDKFLYLIAVY